MSVAQTPEDPRLDQALLDTQKTDVESGQTTPRTKLDTSPEPRPATVVDPSAGSQSAPPTQRKSTPVVGPSAEPHSSTPAVGHPMPRVEMPVVDPLLFVHVTTLGDLEQIRIASENRLRVLTTSTPDEDGITRGFGLDPSHPDVGRLTGITDALVALEHGATLNLKRALRTCSIYPWVKAQRGLGDKQVARLLGVIGDPYWHLAEDRPRTVSELWAYSGLHVLPASQRTPDAQSVDAGGVQPPADHSHPDAQAQPVGGTQASDPGQRKLDAPDAPAGVAARRQKGHRANWSTEAKTRAWVIVESCMKQLDPDCKTDTGIADHQPDCSCSPYRIVVDRRRIHTAVTHPDWTPKHSQLDGMRIASKALLKDLWRESKRLHEAGA